MPNDDYRSQCDEFDLNKAKSLFERFCANLHGDPAKAKTQLIADIQIALREARAEGYSIGKWAKDIPDLPAKEDNSSNQ